MEVCDEDGKTYVPAVGITQEDIDELGVEGEPQEDVYKRQVRMGSNGEAVYSPLITPGTADMVIALEPGEAARALPYLAPALSLIHISPFGTDRGSGRRWPALSAPRRQNPRHPG